MKAQLFLQSLSRQLTNCKRLYNAVHRLHPSNSPVKRQRIQTMVNSKGTAGYLKKKRDPIIFAIAVLSLTGVMGQKFYNQPRLKINTIAPETIRAPYTAEIEDRKKTEAQRKAASKSSVPVLRIDASINQQINQNLQQIFDWGNEIRVAAGSFPFFDTATLSLRSQRYLRSCTDAEWKTLLLALENINKQKSKKILNDSNFSKPEEQSITVPPSSPGSGGEFSTFNSKTGNFLQKADFAQALTELATYRLKTSAQNLSSLITKISQVRRAYSQAIAKLSQLLDSNLQTIYQANFFLDLSDEDWAKTQMGIQQSAQRILTQGIPPGLPTKILEDAVSLQVQTFVPEQARPLAVKLLLTVLVPNLTKDEEQTKLQAQQAAAEVKPVMVKVYKGDTIIRKGERIRAWNLEVLEEYHLIRREVNWKGLLCLTVAVGVSVGIFSLVEQRVQCRWRQSDRLLVLLLVLSIPTVLIVGTPYSSWSGVGLLLGSFYGASLAVTAIGLLAVLLPFSLEVGKISIVAGAAGGILGSCMAPRLRSREELAVLGVAIAVTEGGVYLVIQLLLGAAFSPGLYVVLKQAAFFALSGLVWSIAALGLSPYLEKFFDLVTPIRLAELASPNRPLLQKLATEAPGTFQHTLFVSTLAEAAAKQLGCNVELVRAGTLYHDIGKMHDPLAFIENQMGGPNKHDTEIKDPWKSAEIIKKHVTVGLEIARKHSLPTAIQAFIPEHQGTMQIAYFYHQAQQMAKEDSNVIVNPADFSYDGPIPQSRETGIVMLADSCEAALRSLKDACPEKALTMINNILRARWQDNQLVDSGLTREELTQIAAIFVEVWQQFHHKRIAYPQLKTATKKS